MLLVCVNGASYMLYDPTRAIPANKTTQGEALDQPGDSCQTAHYSVRKQKREHYEAHISKHVPKGFLVAGVYPLGGTWSS